MWFPGDKVQVSLPYGDTGKTVHTATIEKVQDPGPEDARRTIKVQFDDPLIYGGMGYAWVDPLSIAAMGEDPAEPDRRNGDES